MKAFDELTAAGQFRRLRRLALAALEQHALHDLRLAPLFHGENTTFRVDAREGRFMIRVCRPDYQSTAALRSELVWLDALARETSLVVPRPVTARDGELVVTAAADGVPEPRRCVLFEWVPGVLRRRRRTPAQLARIGALMARLHTHAQGWTPPEGFTRMTLDGEGLLGHRSPVGRVDETVTGVEPEVHARLCEARERVQAHLDACGMPEQHSGLIHADLHGGNVLHDGNQVHPIDFDDTGYSHHLLDIAVALGGVHDKPDYVHAFVEGYRSVRPLPDDVLAGLPTFFIARELLMVAWIFARSDNPEIAKYQPTMVQRALGGLERYAAGTLVAL